ncbi:MAG: FmdB family transcriptional regulator [Chloroflexi bacterium HGW-Chloroflexi-2]|nr:MAG: FmdB family transcriptional regulator [Chloroflexi bacterium HGW-Chloroflexi-2]
MMPIYEYICTECHKKFDALRKFSQADDPISCKVCHTTNTKRVISVCNTTSQEKLLSGNGCCSCSGGNCSLCHH